MSDLKEQLQDAGLVGSFGQPLAAGELEEDWFFCIGDSCIACTDSCVFCTNSCLWSTGGC